MATTMTPNMNLSLPGVGTEPGPDYASEVNSSLSTIDQHDHTSGNGVQVPSAGVNINTDLPFGGNNATQLRSARFSPQGSPLALGTDLGCLYESGVDLYYNDGNGNQIRLTASGSIAGATGSISGLVSPASAVYNPGTATFIWQSNSNVAANMDMRSAILRNSSVSSNKITLSAPSSLPSNYSLTLPSALPAAQHFMSLDNSGNIAADWVVDNSTLEISTNTVQVKDLGITAAKIANATITGTQIATNVGLNGDPTLQGSSYYIVAQPAGSPLMLVQGIISSAGSIISGAGFSVAHPSTGRYDISFTIPFGATPSVVAISDSDSGSTLMGYSPSNSSASSVRIVSVNPSGGGVLNNGFTFIALGLRP